MTDPLALVPAPRSWAGRPGRLRIAPGDAVAVAPNVPAELAGAWRDAAELLAELWQPALGARLEVRDAAAAVVLLGYDPDAAGEAYTVDVAERVTVRASTHEGLLHGVHALWQLLDGDGLHCGLLADEPALPWRGLMVDVARHFLPVEFVLALVEAMALHRMNRLHLHLTDDQGWRLQVDALPRLTEVGGWRDATMTGHGLEYVDGVTEMRRERHGGSYSRDDIRRIVARAARHGIVVVPEIDLPGHLGAALAAYPELAVSDPPEQPLGRWGVFDHVPNLRPETVETFRTVLREVVTLFPGPWVHLGGDECPTTRWAADPESLQLMRAAGLDRVEQIQTWFLTQVATVLAEAGRRVVGWDELLDADPPAGALIVAWRDSSQVLRAARAGYDVVAAPQERFYLDRYQVADHEREPLAIGGVSTLRDVYETAVVPPEATADERSHVLGAQLQLWSEYATSAELASYMIFPRMCAFAENVWGTTTSGYDDFLGRLPGLLRQVDALGLTHRPL